MQQSAIKGAAGLFSFWRRWVCGGQKREAEKKDLVFRIVHAKLWGWANDSSMSDHDNAVLSNLGRDDVRSTRWFSVDCTEELGQVLIFDGSGWVCEPQGAWQKLLDAVNLTGQRSSDDMLLEIRYRLRGELHRLLLKNFISFPPYNSSPDQLPQVRLFDRDVTSISVQILFSSDRDDDDDGQTLTDVVQDTVAAEETRQDAAVEIEEPDMDAVLKELRGPGGSLFHQDVPHVCPWEDYKTWLKMFYLEETCLGRDVDPSLLLVSICWSNGDVETF